MRGAWTWIGRRVAVLLKKSTVERELDEEVRFHLEMEIREGVRSGLSETEARRRAMIAFGGVERFKEEVRDARGGRLLDDLRQDLRIGVRTLVKERTFTLAAVLTLAIGIGGNVALYAVLDASAFAALPWAEPDRLLTGRSTFDDGARLGPMLSAFDFYDYRDEARSFERVGALAPFPQRMTLEAGDTPERVDVVMVIPGFFATLGVPPLAGRSFVAEEGEPGGGRAMVLSEGYWTRRFGRDPEVIGRTLTLNGIVFTVVGILPAHARFMVDAELWIPAVRGRGMASGRSSHNFLMVARLAEGITTATAQQELDGISARLAGAYPDTNAGKGIVVTPTREMLLESYWSTLALLGGAVVLLLLVACANVAALLLARGRARVAEMAVRGALGAGRPRLVRQLLVENGLLAAVAGGVGLFVAVWAQRALLAFVSMDRLGTLTGGFSWSILGFAMGLSLLTVLLFGTGPAVRASRTDHAITLRGAGRGTTAGGSALLRRGLVVAQVALTTVLLSAAGLLTRSLRELTTYDLGFDQEGLLTAEFTLPSGAFSEAERAALIDGLDDRLRGLSGVTDLGWASQLPIRDPGNNWSVGRAGELHQAGGRNVNAHQRTVYPGYFEAMGIPLVSGRGFDATDADVEERLIILSRTTAEILFGSEPPEGRFVEIPEFGGGIRTHQVVGVVEDAVVDFMRDGRSPAMYYSYHQTTPSRMRVAVRYAGDPARVTEGVRSALREVAPSVPLDRVETMDAVLRRATADERALASLVGMFAAIALGLAGVGLFGVLAYHVTQREREIGIRIALGARASEVATSVLWSGWVLVGVGLAAGIPLAVMGRRLVEGFLFGVGGGDPLTLIGVAAFLAAVAAVASVLPARRAARINPAEVFRRE